MKVVEKECGPKCRSREHALQMNIAVTKGSLRQTQLFLMTCHNIATNYDHSGRNVLHMAASCGKTDLMHWLITAQRMDVNLKDWEHGWTALHRSLFYGHLAAARLLIQHDAGLGIRDKEGFTPFDVAMKDRLPHVSFEKSGLQEVYTWGDNANFTLGHEKEQRKRYPERVEYFSKRSISIKQVLMCKYHSVFVSSAGHVYTCGHGRGGRLGHGNEETILAPKRIDALAKEECIQVSASNDHTVMLMENGRIFACGLNTYHQLGHQPPSPMSLAPKLVNSKILKGQAILGVVTRKFHTVVYTREAVFTFGLNAGQLGHQKVSGERLISEPRLVSAFNHPDLNIKMVTASDAATVVGTEKGDVYILYEYQCKKIASKWLDGIQLAAVGGQLDHHVEKENLRDSGGSDLMVLRLNSTGNAFCWRSSDPTWHRLLWDMRKPVCIKEIFLSVSLMAFVTSDGEAFTSSLSQFKARSPPKSKALLTSPNQAVSALTLTELINRQSVIETKAERLPLIHRATALALDRKGVNLAALQVQPNASVTELPMSGESQMLEQMKTLKNEADLLDTIHECVVQVGSDRIAVHSFILASKSEFFRKRFESDEPSDLTLEKPVISLDAYRSELVHQLVQFMYTDTCDLITPGHQWEVPSEEEDHTQEHSSDQMEFSKVANKKSGKKSAYEVYQKQRKGSEGAKTEKAAEKTDILQLFLEMAKKLGVGGLVARLKAVCLKNGTVTNVPGKPLPTPKPKWDMSKLPNLCDVWLKADDDVIIPCHKAILVARLEYFHSMLSTGWIESGSSDPLTLPIPSDILTVVLNYLYSDELVGKKVLNDAELLCNILVVADQMLIGRLKELCEVHISALVNLKNACELLEFASTYRAVQLKATCQQFIAINLAALLETRSLDLLSDDVIDELSAAYREMIPRMDHRLITPYDGFPTRGYLESLEEAYPDFTAQTGEEGFLFEAKPREEQKKSSKGKRRRHRVKSTGDDAAITRQSSESSDLLVEVDENAALSPPQSPCSPPQSPPQSPDQNPQESPLVVQQPPIPSITIRTPMLGKTSLHPWPCPAPASPAAKAAPQPQIHTSSQNQTQVPAVAASPSASLRDIMRQQESQMEQMPARQDSKIKSKGKMPGRMSQRERKRLVSTESEETTTPKSPELINVWGKPANPWNKQSVSIVQSFKELVIEQEEDEKKRKQTSKPVEVPPRNISQEVVTVKSPTEVGTSPWGGSSKAQDLPQPPIHSCPSFSKILEDEQQKHENLQRALNKPLHLIQIEEQAIAELLDSYQSKASETEYITVERLTYQSASPTWQATQRQSSNA